MKKITVLLIILLMLIPIKSYSQDFTVGFGTGLVLGLAIASNNSSDVYGGTNPSILYSTSKEVIEKVNPFEMRITYAAMFRSGRADCSVGSRLYDCFSAVVNEPQKYEILQITRIPHGGNEGTQILYFVYIEKEKIKK